MLDRITSSKFFETLDRWYCGQKQNFCLELKKYNNSDKQRWCSCGMSSEGCDYFRVWGMKMSHSNVCLFVCVCVCEGLTHKEVRQANNRVAWKWTVWPVKWNKSLNELFPFVSSSMPPPHPRPGGERSQHRDYAAAGGRALRAGGLLVPMCGLELGGDHQEPQGPRPHRLWVSSLFPPPLPSPITHSLTSPNSPVVASCLSLLTQTSGWTVACKAERPSGSLWNRAGVLKVATAVVYPLRGAASRVYAGAPVGGPRLFVLPLTPLPVRRNLPPPPEFGLFFSLLFFVKTKPNLTASASHSEFNMGQKTR